MKMIKLFAGAAYLFTASAPASADIVCQWMETANSTIDVSRSSTPRTAETTRAAAKVALAMFEALNTIDRRYESYIGAPPADPKASQEAAAATAAYVILSSIFPAQKSAIEANWRLSMEAVRDTTARETGRQIGEQAAKAVLARADVDPSLPQFHYQPQVKPGVWTPWYPARMKPFDFALKPWVLAQSDQFRPSTPPALGSKRWSADFDEVKKWGGKASAERTAYDTFLVRHHDTSDMMPTFRAIADAPGRSYVQNARMFARLRMAADDAFLAETEAKQYYHFWRPIIAIRSAHLDGNEATEADPSWEPVLDTPNHPDYPCGHCTFAAAIGEVLKAEVGNAPPAGVIVLSNINNIKNYQVIPTINRWTEEVSRSRIMGGLHYRFSAEAGEELGRKVGEKVSATIMRPVR